MLGEMGKNVSRKIRENATFSLVTKAGVAGLTLLRIHIYGQLLTVMLASF